jgi:small subunit ribosomal protein S24e
MKVVERKENPLLKRVEIRFRWRHVGTATPSRAQMLAAVAAVEPGSSVENIIVKEVSTRFGQPLTTGLAYIYESADALANEPTYILSRQKSALGLSEEKEAEPEPPAETEPEKADAEAIEEVETEAAEVAGGEE